MLAAGYVLVRDSRWSLSLVVVDMQENLLLVVLVVPMLC